MTRTPGDVTDEQLSEVLRRGRFEDASGITAIVGLLAEAGLAMALQLGVPVDILLPAMAVIGVVIVIAAVAWVVGSVRTNAALHRLSPPLRSPAWAYLLPFGLATGAGIAYANAPDVVQRLLWTGMFAAGVVVFFWVQRRRRRWKHRAERMPPPREN